MSSTRRHDLAEEGRPVTDDSRAFKKSFRTVDVPPVTDNINDQYFRDPPNVTTSHQLFFHVHQGTDHDEQNVEQPARGRATQSVKEGTFEDADRKLEGVLGDQAIGKQTKEAALGEMVNENTVHGGLTGA